MNDLIDVIINDNGDLVISVIESSEYEIADMLQDNDSLTVLCDLFEDYKCNGKYAPFDAGQGNPFVGLTEAPCIAESMDVDDNGQCHILGDLWFYPNYMIRCPIEVLIDKGYVIFERVN